MKIATEAWGLEPTDIKNSGNPTTIKLNYKILKRYRSEERRVGKECRSRWSRYPLVTGVQTCALPIYENSNRSLGAGTNRYKK